jgi:hypothetical protein
MNETEVKRVQLNSARAAFETAQNAYISSLDPAQRAVARSEEPDTKTLMNEAEATYNVSSILLNSLQNTIDFHSVPAQTAELITSMASENAETLKKEIEEVKGQIRVEKRKFLDSSPQTSPAVGGLYFTGVPDNQALLTFLICYGSFWLFLGIMLLSNQIPLPYISGMSSGDRIKLVLSSWVLLIIVTYLGFYMFT